jgi:hypothetical protein
MERAKKARTPARATITRTVNELEAELVKDVLEHQILRIKLLKLDEVSRELMEHDHKVQNAMLDADSPDEEIEAENVSSEEYRDKARTMMVRVNDVLLPPIRPGSPTPSASSFNTAADMQRKPYKYPKIELKKFNGDLKEWLGFWSQFSKIHEDNDLHDSDKFQYLIQSMVVGTRARELVDSYPQTGENYPKVVKALTSRFGKTKLLKQVYVRELLKMVITNATTKIKLSKMHDKLESHLRALESIGVTSEQTAEFLYPMVESSLPEEILIAWQRSPLNGIDGTRQDPPKNELDYLMEFLRKEVENEDQRELAQSGYNQNKDKSYQKEPKKSFTKSEVSTASGLYSGQVNLCIFCDKSHPTQECGMAQQLSLQMKRDKVKGKRACFICLKPGHRTDICKSFVRCVLCTRKHFTIMCPDLPHHKSEQTRVSTGPKKPEAAMSNVSCTREVLLYTLQVRIMGPRESKVVRLLFDNGSQRSYLLQNTAKALSCQSNGEEWIQQSLFSGVLTDPKRYNKYTIRLQSLEGSNYKQIEVVDEKKICGKINGIPAGPWMDELSEDNIHLTDYCASNSEIQILIGSDYYGSCLTGNIRQLNCGLTAIETVFGWTLGGKLPRVSTTYNNLAITSIALHTSEENSLQDLWSLESIGITDPVEHKSKQDKEIAAKEHFLKTVSRTTEGRYSVSLPWTNGQQQIPSNKFLAEKRLVNATNKLNSQDKFKIYDEVFKAWEDEGIIEVVKEETGRSCHYLPHRPVFKLGSETTPVRPVFDASCKYGRNPSLNDCLEKGPNLLEQIPSILLRFREKRIGVISDVRKAFLMIEIKEEERDFLRFLWWEDSTCKVNKIYRHKRVVFGVTCSPFLLGAVIEHHVQQVSEADKSIAQLFLRSLYVDNCVTSVDTIQEYYIFKEATTRIMSEAKMDLRQWECSSGWETGIDSQPIGCGLESSRACTSARMASVLGLKWDKDEDMLRCDYDNNPIPEKVTKRKILSFAQKIYDPIGFLAPALLLPKLILQEAWSAKTGWDEELSEDIATRFGNWAEELHHIEKIQIPRSVRGMISMQSPPHYQLHTFCDASKNAFATVIFLRTEQDGKVNVQLLLAKSRVAPKKNVSIPRLELLSCLIGSRLSKVIEEALSYQDIPKFYWTDSTTALAWIQRNDEWGTFVGNRVREICNSSSAQDWRHIPGIYNPADLPSRGCGFAELLSSKWWEGPDWLKNQKEKWPIENTQVNEEAIVAERKKSASQTLFVAAGELWYCKRYSRFQSNIKVLAWMYRFINKARKQSRERDGLTAAELGSAEIKIFTVVQKESFPIKQEVVNGLRVTRDSEGILYVKTKLTNRPDTDQFKYPILLPSKHPLVEQLIRQVHEDNAHAGAQILMGKLREKYWLLQGRRTIKSILSKCTKCRRFTTKAPVLPEAPLPENRVKESKVFQVTGIDLAGPLFLKDGTKTWLVLFTCAVYRCIHLELVDSISTDAFLLAFSRFISRRGRPTTVYSDNGTNFVGAVNIFKSLDWKRIQKSCLNSNQIQWIFNPPSAAWWGGFWERLIRSVKDLLKRMLGNKKLGYMQLLTKLCEVESIVNARPLTFVTEDQDDLIPLSPSMFLQDIQDSYCPEVSALDENGLKRKHRVMQQLSEELRLRFRKEYLAQLVHRGKSQKHYEFKLGDVVLVGDDNKKRLDWPMARIVQLYIGKDGINRSAKVKTATGFLIRPLQRLYPLEVSLPLLPSIPKDVIQKAVNKKQASIKKKPLSEEVTTPIKEEEPVYTRSGRKVKRPNYY